jgi:dihydrolipoamide dehydrogenase
VLPITEASETASLWLAQPGRGMSRECDLVIIGSGPGGYAAALTARRKGLRVTLIEREAWGGVCLNVGCIPTKALIAVAQTLRKIRQAQELGIRVEGARLDYDVVLARNHRIITQLRQGLVSLLRHHQVELLPGEAAFDDPHTVTVTHEGRLDRVTAKRVLIATGATPNPGPWGFDGATRLSYRHLLSCSTLPRSLLIIGGGIIGCEFASCLSSFGVTVSVIEQQPRLLPMEDTEAVRVLARSLQARGVNVFVGATVKAFTDGSEGVQATLSDGQTLAAERCLIAIGQQPNSRGLGLDRIGIPTEGGIEVNDFLLTRHPHIAAIGDCLAGHGLAHLASAEGQLAVRNLCEGPSASLDQRLVPRCIFTDPELAHVGLVESQAERPIQASRFSFGALGKSLCDEEPEGFVKLLVDPETEKVLGATIVGAQASSLIHVAVLAMQEGLTARQLARSITAHPTLPEAITEAAAQIYGDALFSAGRAREKSVVRSQ